MTIFLVIYLPLTAVFSVYCGFAMATGEANPRKWRRPQ